MLCHPGKETMVTETRGSWESCATVGKQVCADAQFPLSFLVSQGSVYGVVVSTNTWWVFLPRLT